MKRFLLLLLALCPFALRAQPSDPAAVVLQPFIEQYARAYEAARQGACARAEREYLRAIRTYEALSDTLRTNFEARNGDLLAGIYYNLACVQSLQRKHAALGSLTAAIDHDYIRNNYTAYDWMLRDPDLSYLRGLDAFGPLKERAAAQGDYLAILRAAAPYDRTAPTDSLPRFRYAAPNNPDLVRVRTYFKLDSVAGSGDEVSQILNLMHWVHRTVRHDGSSANPVSRNAIDMVELCRSEDRGINCRMMAQMLNECYLALGFRSRFVTCLPKEFVNDCHVICAVYSCTLDKWLWIDPTFDAYVTDEQGTPLGIGEVRERMRDGRPYRLNPEANWNSEIPQTQEEYLDIYMAKNLYYMTCSDRSEFNTETQYEGKQPLHYIGLVPPGYENNADQYDYATTDERWFWTSPYAE